MTAVAEPRIIARRYCDFAGTTYGLAEPYFIAAYLAGAAALPIAVREKTIGQVVSRYEDQLSRFTYDAFNGRMSATDLARAHRGLLNELGSEAYAEGMREAGSKNPDDDWDEDDDAAVKAWLETQLPHVRGYADDAASVAADNTKEARAPILARLELWLEAMRYVGSLGRLNYLGNPALTYNGEDGKESCAECQRYKGQRHKRSWWAQRGLLERNGNDAFGCGRWDECRHHFFGDDGEMVLY